MDLYLAGRLREELAAQGLAAAVETLPDLWDLPAAFESALYPAPEGGERALKLDLVEQAFHVLRPGGTLMVLSPFAPDRLFPELLKKVFGRFHQRAASGGTVLWARREGERPRRRHEVTFHARSGDGPPFRFVSRPGVFSYGRFDLGSRALVEVIEVRPGDRVLDVGCGCGTNGVVAARQSGPAGHTAFVDSNVRAASLAALNAKANGCASFEARATAAVEGFPGQCFDVALANPPYYAYGAIARLFVERSRALLRPGGRFYLVTRQPDEVAALVAEAFGDADVIEHRGYAVFRAVRPMRD
jgi:16S rRNA (guanine1207-N2)-methyltransferase